jgi:hypothetical protein
MLKRADGDRFRLVTQPDHAAVSGYLAAHWGNSDFKPLGRWENSTGAESLRREIVFAIAEHDNGWWEWEADPEIDPADGLPLDFLQASDEGGFDRWKRGAARFESAHPLASLLINRHAYWLQAARVAPIREPQFQHPLFGFRPRLSEPASHEAAALREFLVERLSHERVLLDRLALKGRLWAASTRDGALLPAVRALQALDALSLAMCGTAHEPLRLLEVPRASWDDRVTLEVRPAPDGGIQVTPYPFALDPLPVAIPVRLASPGDWPHSLPKRLLDMSITSS